MLSFTKFCIITICFLRVSCVGAICVFGSNSAFKLQALYSPDTRILDVIGVRAQIRRRDGFYGRAGQQTEIIDHELVDELFELLLVRETRLAHNARVGLRALRQHPGQAQAQLVEVSPTKLQAL